MKTALTACAGLVLGLCGGAPAQIAGDHSGTTPQTAASSSAAPTAISAVNTLADDYLKTLLALTPEFGTQEGIPGAHHGEITDNSLDGVRRIRAQFDALSKRLLAIDASTLQGHPEWITYGVLREALEGERQQRVCHFELWNVASYVNGWQAEYTDLASIQPVGTVELRRQALARARALPRYIDREITNLRQGLQQHYSAPKVIVRNVIRQLDDLTSMPPEKSPFYSPAQRDKDAEFGRELAGVISREINPAIRRYRNFLSTTYLAQARETIGLSDIPNGRECYRATLRGFSTLNISEDEVFETGLREMSRIEAEMRTISQHSFGGAPLAELLPQLRTEPRYTYRSADEILRTAQAAIDRAKAATPKWFGRVPKAEVVIQPYPEFRQKAGAPGQLISPPEDGSRPAIFLINLYQPETKSRADTENLAFHETIPGHHLQGAIAKERRDLHPLVRNTFSSGFGEGWALYAEGLADEMGLYASDVGRMGMLASEAFRAARMVIDAGIHTRGWKREQALEYLMSHTVVSEAEAQGEIDRYISWPGQAPSYMIGRLEILRLRSDAQQQLGAKFDIREFHDRVLENGCVPLEFLRSNIKLWLASKVTSARARP